MKPVIVTSEIFPKHLELLARRRVYAVIGQTLLQPWECQALADRLKDAPEPQPQDYGQAVITYQVDRRQWLGQVAKIMSDASRPPEEHTKRALAAHRNAPCHSKKVPGYWEAPCSLLDEGAHVPWHRDEPPSQILSSAGSFPAFFSWNVVLERPRAGGRILLATDTGETISVDPRVGALTLINAAVPHSVERVLAGARIAARGKVCVDSGRLTLVSLV